jgi:hypothetical protein
VSGVLPTTTATLDESDWRYQGWRVAVAAAAGVFFAAIPQ